MHEQEKATHKVSVINSTRGVEIFSTLSTGRHREETSDGHYLNFKAAEKAKQRLETGWMLLESTQIATFMLSALGGLRALTLNLEPHLSTSAVVGFTVAAGMSLNLALRSGRDRERNQQEIVAIQQAELYKKPQYDQEFEI